VHSIHPPGEIGNTARNSSRLVLLRVFRVHSRTKCSFLLDYPVMIDNDFAYWKALDNRFWPAFYLVDRQGRIRARFVGETRQGDRQALRIESEIEDLIDER
jgi:hypothetical protein